MIEALAIGGLGVGALSVIAIGLVCYWWRDAVVGERAALASESLAVQARFVAEASRDGALAQTAELETENKGLRAQVAAAQASLNAATKELVDRVQKEIVAGTPGDAVRIVDELLAHPILPNAATTAGPAAADHGGSGSAAVQPAPAADAGGAGRST